MSTSRCIVNTPSAAACILGFGFLRYLCHWGRMVYDVTVENKLDEGQREFMKVVHVLHEDGKRLDGFVHEDELIHENEYKEKEKVRV